MFAYCTDVLLFRGRGLPAHHGGTSVAGAPVLLEMLAMAVSA